MLTTSCRHPAGLVGCEADGEEFNGAHRAAGAALHIPRQLHAGVTLALQGAHKRAGRATNSRCELRRAFPGGCEMCVESGHDLKMPYRQNSINDKCAHLALADICLYGKSSPMPNYPNRIRELRLNREITAERLAEMTGLSVSYLTRLETGARNLSVKNLDKFARAFGVDQGDLLLSSEVRITDVPVISWVSAGSMWAHEVEPSGRASRSISAVDLPSGDWLALVVDGDSMDRIAPPGSTILVNRKDRDLVAGKAYVFGYDNGEATFKRYRANPDRLEPMSTNPEHEAIFPENGLHVIGRVRRVIVELD